MWSREQAQWLQPPGGTWLGFRCAAAVRFGMALFPVPAHRTGQARFAHPALGESSRGRPRKTARPRGQPDEAKLVVQAGFRKLLDRRPMLVVLGTQPLSQPLASVSFHRSIGFTDWSQTEVVSPPNHHPIEGRDYCLPVQLGFTPAGFLADRFTDALHPLLRGSRAQIGAARFRRVTSTETIAQKIELFFRQLTDPRLLFVHRQLQLRHHVPHLTKASSAW